MRPSLLRFFTLWYKIPDNGKEVPKSRDELMSLIARPIDSSVELDDIALKRLPPLFREIVEYQREIDEAVSRPLVDFETVKRMFGHRKYLARHAHRKWCSD